MGNNGKNKYGVTYNDIKFLERVIATHKNVSDFRRTDDIVFHVDRIEQSDTVKVICLNEYILSEALAREIIQVFNDTGIIYVGGKWNHASEPSSGFCRDHKVGICNAGSVNAALRKTRFWL